jgi:hypothetical protein
MSPVVVNQMMDYHLHAHVKYNEHFDYVEPNISLRWRNESISSKMKTLNYEPYWRYPKLNGPGSVRVLRAKARV